MSASSKLSNNKLTFTATDASTGDLEFGTSGFSFNKSIAFSGGITSNSVTVESGSIEVANQSDLKLSGATSGTLTIKPAAVTTDHTLTLPDNKGDDNSHLKSTSAGVLSWVVPPSYSTMFDINGSEIFYWDGRTNPSSNSPVLNVAGNAAYVATTNNNFVRVVNGGGQTSYVNFDASTSYANYKLVVYYKILNTSEPADLFWVFGQGTQNNSGSYSTGGLQYTTDYYNTNSHVHRDKIEVYNGSTYDTVKAYANTGIDDINSNFVKLTLIRYGNNVEVIHESSDIGYYKLTATTSQSLSGTRYGIGAMTGSEAMTLEIRSMSLTVLT